MEKEIKIVPPDGYEIDRENSTLECIKFKPITKRWRDSMLNTEGYYIDCDSMIKHVKTLNGANNRLNRNVFATMKQAVSTLAMAQISQIMANDERFGGVVTDEEWKEAITNKFVIIRVNNKIIKTSYSTCYEFLSFHTQEQRDLFLEENEDLIRDYLMLN